MLSMPRAVYAAIIEKARQGAPLETCGLLAGYNNMVNMFYELTNVDASPEHFSLAPEEQLLAVQDARSRGARIIGVVHSHPLTPARPSAEDIELAFDPDQIYFIVSLAEPEPVLKAFRIRQRQIQEEAIEIVKEQEAVKTLKIKENMSYTKKGNSNDTPLDTKKIYLYLTITSK